jgi:serine/threonine protein kinase
VTSLGRVVAGRYRMLYPLGRGGMGAVWVGEHIELKSAVAVKFIDQHLAEDERAKKRFRLEAQAAAALRSPHVVQVFDYGIDEGEPYIVMELLEGETLATRLQRAGQLTVQESVELCRQTAKALGVAHERGFVHRDLKPENVFLVGDETGFIVKLLDFGVAKVIREDRRWSEFVTQPGNRLGTIYYMSPEQVQGQAVDARADVWSLGIVMFECLTGRLPFEGIRGPRLISAISRQPLPVPSRLARVPAGFDAWFERATMRELDRREPSVEVLARELTALAQGFSGKCSIVPLGEEDHQTLPNLVAFATASGTAHEGSNPPTVHEEIPDDFPDSFRSDSGTPERTSIPAAINGRRDLDHVALIARLSRRRAVLWTRHRVAAGDQIHLTLLSRDEEVGHMTAAEVERVNTNKGDRPDFWTCEVVVRFHTPLTESALAAV